jgi:hypothetical protein
MGAESGNESHGPLPAHTVRVSRRARRVLLRVIPGKGLEIVAPFGFDLREIPGILHKHRDWIARQMDRAEAAPAVNTGNLPLPQSLELRALGLCIEVSYASGPGKTTRLVSVDPGHIEVQGDLDDRMCCFRLLREWARMRARFHLVRKVAELSNETGFGYGSIQIRGQKGRWGSYSSRGVVSLNWKLLFLPPEWVRYLIIHELCHSVHLNHSPRFWELVRRHEPEYKTLDNRLRKAMVLVPAWADMS